MPPTLLLVLLELPVPLVPRPPELVPLELVPLEDGSLLLELLL
jgi:hypothetical protein